MKYSSLLRAINALQLSVWMNSHLSPEIYLDVEHYREDDPDGAIPLLVRFQSEGGRTCVMRMDVSGGLITETEAITKLVIGQIKAASRSLNENT